MNFPNKKVAAVIGALLVIAAAVGAYQFRRDSNLTGTSWTGTAAGTNYEINFISGRKVVVKRSTEADPKPTALEGTYTSRGNHVEIHVPTAALEGDAIIEAGKGEFIDLTMTPYDASAPIKLKVAKTTSY